MRIWPRFVYEWGPTAQEIADQFPCDALIGEAGESFHRAIEIDAPAEIVFRWLCQLRAAPYSYDLIDNRGRRSPQSLTSGLERLERGQRVMSIFRLAEFEPGRSITLTSRTSLFGEIACTYRVRELAPGRSRLAVRLLVEPRGVLRALALHTLLGPGDLVMMRRQLLNLAGLAEREAAASARA